jgi:lysophospholipase L1-like esterase
MAWPRLAGPRNAFARRVNIDPELPLMTATSATAPASSREPTPETGALPAPQQASAGQIASRHRRWMPVAMVSGSFAFTMAIASAAGEIGMRYYEGHRSSVPGTMQALFYPHLRQRYALVRNADYYGWVHTNAQGMRGHAIPLARTPGVPRIMIVGGSTTFDTFVRGDDETWPAQLQAELTRLRGGHQIEVVNAGVPGYRLLDNIIRLQTELYRFRPDVIVYYEAHNDIFNAFREGVEVQRPTNTPDEMPVVTPWTRWLERHSLLYDKVLSRLLAMNFARASRAELPRARAGDSLLKATLDSGVASFERDLTSFVLIAQSFGAQVVIPEVVHVTGPRVDLERDPRVRRLWSSSVPFAPPETLLRAYIRYDDVARAVAAKRGATYIPTIGFGLTGTQWYSPGDPIHFNNAGAQRMGQSMARALVAAGVVDTSAAPVARVAVSR